MEENLDVSLAVKYIDITPTWSAVWKIYAQVYANGDTFAGRKEAESELSRMAALADKWVEHCKKERESTKDEHN